MVSPTIESFTSTGTTSWTAPAGVTSVDYLVVGGGGGGGNGYDTGGGGGGGGGMVLSGTLSVSPGNSYTVTVGAGGAGGADTRANQNGAAGGDSVFSSVTAFGGDLGNGSRTVQVSHGDGGDAQDGSTTSARGGDGGGNSGTAAGGSGGGGGGANGAGSNGIPGSGGAGGSGISSSISGSSNTYGVGGAGARGNFSTTEGANGVVNTGNGGGGGGAASFDSGGGGTGGSGIVILSYTASSLPCILRGSLVLTQDGYKPIEDLGDNDRIQTSDGRLISFQKRSFKVLADQENAPYRIPQHYFRNQIPSKDTYLSGKHGIILGSSTRMYPSRMTYIYQVKLGEIVEYFHLELPDFERDSIVCHGMNLEGFCNDHLKKNKKQMIIRNVKRCEKGNLYQLSIQ